MYPFEPRSKIYTYDDDETTGIEPAWDWKFIIFLPFAVILLTLFSVTPFLALLLYFLHDVYTTLRKTMNTGEFSYPFLVKTGAIISVILVVYFFFGGSVQPGVSLFLAIGFILIFTVLPFLARCIHWLRTFFVPRFN